MLKKMTFRFRMPTVQYGYREEEYTCEFEKSDRFSVVEEIRMLHEISMVSAAIEQENSFKSNKDLQKELVNKNSKTSFEVVESSYSAEDDDPIPFN